jgi:CRP/FNR family cyclic AMP-dependent transcriptional regulator
VQVWRSANSSICRVLAEDPRLASSVPRAQLPRAIEECLAEVISIPAGPWLGEPAPAAAPSPGHVGLLVLDGLIARRVGVDGRFGAELLGEGDLLRPWQADSGASLGTLSAWRVLEHARLAVLDEVATRRMMRYPELTGALVERALQRSRSLAVNMAIVHQPRVETRLRMLFWHLADRWGIQTADGVQLRMRLSHEVLADLLAARRSTISCALSALARAGELSFDGRNWTLRGSPPGDLPAV